MSRKFDRKGARTAAQAVRALPRHFGRALPVALALSLLAFASLVQAGPPVHPPEPDPIGGFPLDRACGTAVDSEGDIYASNAGESKIEVFDPSGSHLTSIPNVNVPCGLAVDSHGVIFVAEKGTGDVVRYVPSEFPFAGTPSYGAPEAIDASGEAEGIAIDSALLLTNSDFVIGRDNSLYIAKGDHIDAYRNETQRIQVSAAGGTYTLTFEGQTTGSIPFDADHAAVQEALESLPAIGEGGVSISTGNFQPTDHLITFTGALGLTDVPPIEFDESGLAGGTISHSETDGGFVAAIGSGGALTDATGVAAYTYRVSSEQADRYVFAADTATDEVKVFAGPDIASLKLRRTIDGVDHDRDPDTPDQEFGFGPVGAYLAVDPGNRSDQNKCASIADQACTAGHLLVYDAAHDAVDELEANGEFLDQVVEEGFSDAEPTGLAIDRSGGVNDGRIYVTAGAGPGAGLFAFEPLPAPSRPPLGEPQSKKGLATARAVATDSQGNIYVAVGPAVRIFRPNGKEILVGPEGKGISTTEPAADLAVDSSGRVYVLVEGNGLPDPSQYKVKYYTPASFPPGDGTQYGGPVTVATGNSFTPPGTELSAIGLNLANDHVFVAETGGRLLELGSAAEGSPTLDPCFACGLSVTLPADVAVHGPTGNVYVSEQFGRILVIDPTGTEVLARITGAGSPQGPFSGSPGVLAVDQSNGHVLAFKSNRNTAEEYDASGAFVAQFGSFTSLVRGSGIAIDNSDGVASGNVYIAFDDTAPDSFDLTAFGPLSYGEPPIATTGTADGIGTGEATLNGTVDPRGFEVEDCHFEYLTEAQYLVNGKIFTGAISVPCIESSGEIGKGTSPVSVHAEISGLDPEGRYRFRLVAANKYGTAEGKAWLFGPPLLSTSKALPVLYDEAILNAAIDPSGLATEYRFVYGTSEAYGQSTPTFEIPAGDGPVQVKVSLTGLAEGTEYHFRILVENEVKTVEGPDQTFETLERSESSSCSNTQFRIGLSAGLPDCRAYELVTPPETRGDVPGAAAPGSAGQEFNNWLVAPRGAGAGESVAFFNSTLPGFEGSGATDGYRAARAAGGHPPAGWTTELISPTYSQIGVDGTGQQHGVASDQRYWLYEIGGASEALPGTLPAGEYLRTPSGVAHPKCNPVPQQDRFELIGCGSLGTDPNAASRYVNPGGSHLIFFSDERLESAAPPEGTMAIYDRAAGEPVAEVVSIRPDGTPFAAGEDATYVAATEDGAAVVFRVGGSLYLRRGGETTEIADAPNTFAGVSEDGTRVFYVDATFPELSPQPAGLFACDVEVGPCTGGGEPPGVTQIAANSIFVNVSADGSGVLFTSEDALPGLQPNENGETAEDGVSNLYAWDDGERRFVAVLDPEDFVSFGGSGFVKLNSWTTAINPGAGIGRNKSPTRSTPDGEVFAFQSHAQLTSYDNDGHSTIYRYEPAAASGQQLICASCDPTGAPASADAGLLVERPPGVARSSTLVPNVTDDGNAVFFQSLESLLPSDANDTDDVYEWKAQGTGCGRSDGCLALISSGQGEQPSYLYGMSANGRDVFFVTPEKLVNRDIPGSHSIYDARIEGGIPDPPGQEDCQGDACQGQGSVPPALPPPASTGSSNGNVLPSGKRRCPKGKRKVRRKGKVRCVKRKASKRHGRARR